MNSAVLIRRSAFLVGCAAAALVAAPATAQDAGNGTEEVFAQPRHPYTKGLLQAVPRLDRDDGDLQTIAGEPPDMSRLPAGCPFSPRCATMLEKCPAVRPELVTTSDGRRRACHLSIEEVVQ